MKSQMQKNINMINDHHAFLRWSSMANALHANDNSTHISAERPSQNKIPFHIVNFPTILLMKIDRCKCRCVLSMPVLVVFAACIRVLMHSQKIMLQKTANATMIYAIRGA